jgi:hypothetical protein
MSPLTGSLGSLLEQFKKNAPAWLASADAKFDIDYAGNRAYDGAVKTPTALTTISRASSKYAVSSAGAYTLFGSGALTMTDLGINGEEARTELTQHNDNTNDTSWASNHLTRLPGQIGPDVANATANLLTDDAVSSVHNAAPASVTFSLGTTYVMAYMVKTGTDNRIQLLFPISAFTNQAFANFNLTTPAVTLVGSSVAASGIISVGGGYFICWFAAPCTAGATGVPAIVRANADNMTRSAAYVGSGTTITGWLLACQAGSFPLSPIYNPNGANQVKAADNISIAQGPWFNGVAGTWYVKARVPVVAIPDAVLLIGNGAKGLKMGLDIGGDRMRLQVFHGSQRGDTGSNAATMTPGAIVKAALSYDGVGVPLFSVNGATVASAATPPQADFDTSPLSILSTDTPSNSWNDFLAEIAFLPTKNQTQLNALTT